MRAAALLLLAALPAAAKTKTETEIRSALTAEGCGKVLALAAGATASRADVYFDRYAGGVFVLKAAGSYKVRVKSAAGEALLKTQVSRVVAKETLTDGALEASVTTTESAKGSVAPEKTQALAAAVDAFVAALDSPSAPLRAKAEAAGALLKSAAPEGLSLAESAGGPGGVWMAAAQNVKRRRTVAVPLASGPLEAEVGVTEARDEDGKAVHLCELEAETKAPDPKAQARELLAWLKGLGVKETGGASPNAFAYAEKRLVAEAPPP